MHGLYKNHRIQLLPIERNAHVEDIVESETAIAQTFLYPRQIVQICLWIINSGCSKHLTGNRALLTNFMEKFLGTVRFGNNDFAVIAGYGNVVIVQTSGSGISYLLAVATIFTGSGNLYCQWELLTWQWACLVHFIPNTL
uniref:Integrase, catalytic region, zinc finger, CCHC-type, peptidase aspartic, catalytic n=1 Tax=Tanacetum cinerariifolium TaxID=118510 RepID=A0A6L2LJW4_TANCI|nr:integrase, catalytic region, zinc finger, CCHC-type, peptidase aspartic, catalytic [Tanacetum cinerariifolium]